jgi:chlorocatechol 1,2-dioxygenase
MSDNRIETVVSAIVDGVRAALSDHDVTFDEYRTGLRYLMENAASGELPLLVDVFFNTTICDIENCNFEGSTSTLEGPYYLDDAPFVTESLRIYEHDDGEPLLLKGRVTDTEGKPISGAIVDIWHSTPDGLYGGFHGDIPRDCYRGKLRTDANGDYEVSTTLPVAYQIPHSGPTGRLLEIMGRHSWRPAHVHYKVKSEGFHTLTTQAYFEGGEYVDSDCCEGVFPDQIHSALRQDGRRILTNDFQLAAAQARATVAA